MPSRYIVHSRRWSPAPVFSTCDVSFSSFFFFQAEDGIRDTSVTRVQTCALPILDALLDATPTTDPTTHERITKEQLRGNLIRSEERRVGKECRSQWATQH